MRVVVHARLSDQPLSRPSLHASSAHKQAHFPHLHTQLRQLSQARASIHHPDRSQVSGALAARRRANALVAASATHQLIQRRLQLQPGHVHHQAKQNNPIQNIQNQPVACMSLAAVSSLVQPPRPRILAALSRVQPKSAQKAQSHAPSTPQPARLALLEHQPIAQQRESKRVLEPDQHYVGQNASI